MSKIYFNQEGGVEEQSDEKENDQSIISEPSTTTNMDSAQKHKKNRMSSIKSLVCFR